LPFGYAATLLTAFLQLPVTSNGLDCSRAIAERTINASSSGVARRFRYRVFHCATFSSILHAPLSQLVALFILG
jgi:hypothetical protein